MNRYQLYYFLGRRISTKSLQVVINCPPGVIILTIETSPAKESAAPPTRSTAAEERSTAPISSWAWFQEFPTKNVAIVPSLFPLMYVEKPTNCQILGVIFGFVVKLVAGLSNI